MFFTKLFLHALYGVSDHKSSQLVGADFTKRAGDIEMAAILPQIISDVMDALNGDMATLDVSYYKHFFEYTPGKTTVTSTDNCDDWVTEENAKNLLGKRHGIAALSLNGTLFVRSEKVIYHFDAPHGILGDEYATLITISVRKVANKKYTFNVRFGPAQPKKIVFGVLDCIAKHTKFKKIEFM